MATRKSIHAAAALDRERFIDEIEAQMRRGEKVNATQAAIKVGYSEKNARAYASTLMTDPIVFEEIEARRKKLASIANIDAARVLIELARLGTSDVGGAFDEDGQLLPINEIPEDIRRAIASVETEELFEGRGQERVHIGYTKKVKFYDKGAALRTLAQNFGMLIEKHEITGKITLEDFIAQSRKDEK